MDSSAKILYEIVEKVKFEVNLIHSGALKSQHNVNPGAWKCHITSEGRCHHMPCRLGPDLAYKTSRGGTQLGQIEARPFVWVTVTTLICMQAYRPLGSTGLTLSHTLIYVLISPYVLFSSLLPCPPSTLYFIATFLSSQMFFSCLY